MLFCEEDDPSHCSARRAASRNSGCRSYNLCKGLMSLLAACAVTKEYPFNTPTALTTSPSSHRPVGARMECPMHESMPGTTGPPRRADVSIDVFRGYEPYGGTSILGIRIPLSRSQKSILTRKLNNLRFRLLRQLEIGLHRLSGQVDG